MKTTAWLMVLWVGMAWGQAGITAESKKCPAGQEPSVVLSSDAEGHVSIGKATCIPVATQAPVEPLDVPAIAGKWVVQGHDENCISVWPGIESRVVTSFGFCQKRRHTCADKSRILEHDGQTPAKYWCRKVQSETKP